MQTNILVIGGGPAGMMAAVTARRLGASVILLEPNAQLGRKLRITGKGRCNVTNDCSPQEMLQNVTRNQKFLYSAIFRFPPEETKKYFESLGVALKTERGRRVFPVSDKAGDIAGAMVRDVNRSGVSVVRGKAQAIRTPEAAGTCFEVETESESIRADAVILATGGLSYPGTGSTGDGLRMAETLGLKMVETKPSLVPICTKEDVSEMMGLSLKNVTLTLENQKGKELFQELGEMLFTHFGISGPLSLSSSAHMQNEPVTNYRLWIDWKPGLTEEQLDQRLTRDFLANTTRDFCNALGALLPSSAIPYVVTHAGIPPHKKVNQITREERQAFARYLKHFPLTPVGFRPIDEAIVTSGGVAVTEIDPKTMMAKKIPGLFFAGEMLDLDAYTGGYNLQIAFATGHAAGEGAAHFVEQKTQEEE